MLELHRNLREEVHDTVTLQEVSLELMLLGCTPDAASEIDSAANSQDINPVDKAFECELLCHVACATDLPLPNRCAEIHAEAF